MNAYDDPRTNRALFCDIFGRGHHEHDQHGHDRGHGGWGGMFGRPGFAPPRGAGRARRGDVQAAVLSLLSEGSMHGYQIIQELSIRSGGAWTPGPGSIYPTLQAMEEQGLVVGEQAGSKKVYSLTDEGKAALEQQQMRAPWEQLAEASGSRLDLRQSMASLWMAAAQLERTGTDEQIGKAATLVDDLRKALYLMLAE